jgi:hypothetical protein
MTVSRQALSTFDIKPTAASLPAGLKPDELMFDWTALPAGATASIYFPAIGASEIVKTAGSMYGSQPFTSIDANTVGCDCKGTTFMPIPPGSGNYAALLAIGLPPTVGRGGRYTVTVTQLTNAQGPSRRAKGGLLTWRKIVGTFHLAIKMESEAKSLPKIEQNLALLRWIFSTLPSASRWYPVMQRYLCAVADQVTSLGGDPNSISPSATGTWPGGPSPGSGGPHPKGQPGYIGKISELLYDHFADFEGFTLETESGETFTFLSRESHMEQLIRQAWAERLRVTVIPDRHHKERPRQIVLHRPFHH